MTALRGNTITSIIFASLVFAQIVCDTVEETSPSRVIRTRTRRRAVRRVFNNFMRFQRALDVLKRRADFAGDIGETKVYTKTGGLREAIGEFLLLDAKEIRQLDTKNGDYIKLGNIADDTYVKLKSKDLSVKPPCSTIELWKASSVKLGDVKCVAKIVYKDG